MTLQIYIIIFYAVFKEQTIVTDCLNQLSFFSISQTSCQILNGGDEEIRTPDPLLARQVLSQLSYAPMMVHLSLDNLFRRIRYLL